MIQNSLISLFERDLDKVKLELKNYQAEKNIWLNNESIKNSTGNLTLHICGNLQHFIGGVIGESGYIRNRENEFELKNVPIEELLMEIEKTKKIVLEVIKDINKKQLIEDFPIEVFGDKMKTVFFLIHLSGHLTYHLGQINYHRQFFDNK